MRSIMSLINVNAAATRQALFNPARSARQSSRWYIALFGSAFLLLLGAFVFAMPAYALNAVAYTDSGIDKLSTAPDTQTERANTGGLIDPHSPLVEIPRVLAPNMPADNPFTDISAGLVGVYYSSVAWGDYNNDDLLDVLITGYSGSSSVSRIYRNNGDGSFTDIMAGLTGVYYSSAAWGDYDNDGRLDILLTGFSSTGPIARVYRNNGNGFFTYVDAGLTGVYFSSVAWGDYDRDGRLDILLTGSTGSASIARVYRNNGDGTFSDINAGLTGVNYGTVAWGDYNNDGRLDILMTGYTGSVYIAQVHRNNGNGTFTDIGAGLTGVYRSSAAWGDYDNDGLLDIALIGHTGSASVGRVYRNNGNDTFLQVNAGIPNAYYGSLAWGDYDNDGYSDLLYAGNTGAGFAARVYRNNGDGTFLDIGAGLTGVQYSSAAWADYNNDGRLDMLIAGNSGSGIFSRIYQNNHSIINTPPSPPTGLTTTVSGNLFTFSWLPATDAQTPGAALSYNLRIGTTPGGGQVVPPLSDTDTGFRQVAQLGNMGNRLTATMILSPNLTYYWSVQAVDSVFAGSAFADEGEYSLIRVTLDGRTHGLVSQTLVFTANVAPLTTTLPITYVWQVTGQAPIMRNASIARSDVVSYTWLEDGIKMVTVAVTNAEGLRSVTSLALAINYPPPPIGKAVGPKGDVAAGALLSYSIYYYNDDELPLTGIIITDILSAGISFVDASPGASVANGEVVWQIGALSPGGSGSLAVRARVNGDVPAGTVITNTAWLQSNEKPLRFAKPVSTTIVLKPDFSLSVLRASADIPPRPGDYITYTIHYTNGGTMPGSGVAISNLLPSGVSHVSGGVFTNGAVTFDLGTLAVGASGSAQWRARINGNTPVRTIITNTAVILSNQTQPFATDPVTTTVTAPELQLTKSVTPTTGVATGSTLTYTIISTNTGNYPAHGIVISDPLPAGMIYLAGGTLNTGVITWSLSTLGAGASQQLTFTAFITAGTTTIVNQAIAVCASCAHGVRSSNAVSTVLPLPLMRVHKTVQPVGTVWSGTRLTYTLIYSNSGNVPATGAVLLDALPLGLAHLNGGNYQAASRTVSFTLGNVPAGHTAVLSFTAQLTAPGGSIIVNTAQIFDDLTYPSSHQSAAPLDVEGTLSFDPLGGNSGPRFAAQSFVATAPRLRSIGAVLQGIAAPYPPARMMLWGDTGGLPDSAKEMAATEMLTDLSAQGQRYFITPILPINLNVGERYWLVLFADNTPNGSAGIRYAPANPYAAGYWRYSSNGSTWFAWDDTTDLDLRVNYVPPPQSDPVTTTLHGTPPVTLTLSGSTLVYPNAENKYVAVVSPLTTTFPLTYTWQATDYATVVRSSIYSASNAISYTWTTSGVKYISVTVQNAWGSASAFSSFSVTPPVVDIGAGVSGVSNGSVAWGDYDNDGYLDFAFTGYTGSAYLARIYRNNGNSTFTDINAGLTGVQHSSMAWGDYDNDGYLDLLIAGHTGSAYITRVYRNNGNGTFLDINAGLVGLRYGSVAWGDYDNDGRLDILATGFTGSLYIARVYRNNGNGTFSDIGAALTGVRYSAAAWGDYNNDGRLDILIAGSTSSENVTRVYRNNGDGTFSGFGAGLPNVNMGSVAWGDYNSDGWLDILLTGNTGSTYITRVYRNNGNGTFSEISAGLPGVYNGTAVWGDYDGDGRLDILLAGNTGSAKITAVYRNNGDGSFSNANAGLPGLHFAAAAWGDLDNDGRLDMLLNGHTGVVVLSRVYRNHGSLINTPPAPPTLYGASVSGNLVTFAWSPASDAQTTGANLTYNLRVGTTPGGSQIVAPLANGGNGFRRVAQLGNLGHRITATYNLAPNITYYWSVQAVDASFAGSAFGNESSTAQPVAPGALVEGAQMGSVGAAHTFTATAIPQTVTRPLTYTWQTAGQAPVVHANLQSMTDTAAFAWSNAGTKVVTVTISNKAGVATATHQIAVITPPASVSLNGAAEVIANTLADYTATVNPPETWLPLTYVWQATGHAPQTHAGINSRTDSASFSWGSAGAKTVTVIASNGAASVSSTWVVTVYVAPSHVSLSGPTHGISQTVYSFQASVAPADTALPITYTWQASDQPLQGRAASASLTDTATFSWDIEGDKWVTVTASNAYGSVSQTHYLALGAPQTPEGVLVNGAAQARIHAPTAFIALVNPISATPPLTFTWYATGLPPITRTNIQLISDVVTFTWDVTGAQSVTVWAANAYGVVSATVELTVTPVYLFLPLVFSP